MAQREGTFAIRVSASEREALRKLAEREARTESSWLRSRILSEAVAAGLYRFEGEHQVREQRQSDLVGR